MRFPRALALLVPAVALSGCGYVHFGRLPKAGGDVALQHAYSDLALEHKVLKQELVLAHKETDSLRAALERTGGTTAPGAPDLVRQLEQTSEELATLRASYAKLKAERAAPAAAATTMAAADSATLQNENTRLRHELDASRQENAALAEQLKNSVARNEQAQASLTQLNTELLDQKQARERAEQATLALRAQLQAVMARAGRAEEAGNPAQAAELSPTEPATATASDNPLSALQSAKSPPSGAVPRVELHTSLDRARSAVAATPTPTPDLSPSAAEPMPAASRTAAPTTIAPAPAEAVSDSATKPVPVAAPAKSYTVQAGDTLERISVKVYGAADQWGKIYAANAEVLGSSQGLKPGMKLTIPAE